MEICDGKNKENYTKYKRTKTETITEDKKSAQDKNQKTLKIHAPRNRAMHSDTVIYASCMNLHRILDIEVEEGEENVDCNKRITCRRQSKIEIKDAKCD